MEFPHCYAQACPSIVNLAFYFELESKVVILYVNPSAIPIALGIWITCDNSQVNAVKIPTGANARSGFEGAGPRTTAEYEPLDAVSCRWLRR
jgi:hypothetical protein